MLILGICLCNSYSDAHQPSCQDHRLLSRKARQTSIIGQGLHTHTHTHIASNHQPCMETQSPSAPLKWRCAKLGKFLLSGCICFLRTNARWVPTPQVYRCYQLSSWNYCAEKGHRKYLPTVALVLSAISSPDAQNKKTVTPTKTKAKGGSCAACTA